MTQRTDSPSAEVRIRVMKRDRFSCTYCGVAGSEAELEIDHIIPVSGGGSHHISNLTTSCRACNQKKGSREISPRHSNNGATTNAGLWLHTLDRDGGIYWQGCVLSIDGETALVQLFSWLTGEPTNVATIPKSELYDSAKTTLYGDREQMLSGYEKFCRRWRNRA